MDSYRYTWWPVLMVIWCDICYDMAYSQTNSIRVCWRQPTARLECNPGFVIDQVDIVLGISKIGLDPDCPEDPTRANCTTAISTPPWFREQCQGKTSCDVNVDDILVVNQTDKCRSTKYVYWVFNYTCVTNVSAVPETSTSTQSITTTPTTISATTSTSTLTSTPIPTRRTQATSVKVSSVTVAVTTAIFTTPTTPPDSAGLNAAAIGGIVVGAVLGTLIIAVIIFFFVRRRTTKTEKWHQVFTNLFTKKKPTGSSKSMPSPGPPESPTERKYEPLQRGSSPDQPDIHSYAETTLTSKELTRQESGPLYDSVLEQAEAPHRIVTGEGVYVNAERASSPTKAANAATFSNHQYVNAHEKPEKKKKPNFSNKLKRKPKPNSKPEGLEDKVHVPASAPEGGGHSETHGQVYENVEPAPNQQSYVPMGGEGKNAAKKVAHRPSPEKDHNKNMRPLAYEDVDLRPADAVLYTNEEELAKHRKTAGVKY